MNVLWIPALGISVALLAVFANQIFRPWLRLQERKMELDANMVAEKAAQYAAQTERLEQRVRVLERIITDKGVDLSDQIERLRDEPVN
ncbi:hypothetical protein OF829_13920 [Sphingomonas sp. LB-2]|uniref:hypothetical protein n=1 Tax=Sphingomonas caeni TaxID=2984949 RepID=UPI00223126ED|nr:hypothetical protein [Sphingomonas caeni]MCW3848338.1 hypothetical protein [Sphingomonas caeni]